MSLILFFFLPTVHFPLYFTKIGLVTLPKHIMGKDEGPIVPVDFPEAVHVHLADEGAPLAMPEIGR